MADTRKEFTRRAVDRARTDSYPVHDNHVMREMIFELLDRIEKLEKRLDATSPPITRITSIF